MLRERAPKIGGETGSPRPTPHAHTAGGDAGSDAVVREFHEALARAPDMAVAVAAIKVRGVD